jgi:hypothetical protein
VAAAVFAGPTLGHERPRVTLNHGRLLGERWITRLYRWRHHRQPCFEVDTQPGHSFLAECGRPERRFVPILSVESGSGSRAGTVMLVATSLKVHRVHLEFYDRPDLDVRPQQISRAKARPAGVARSFRYQTLTYRGTVCLRRHIDYSSDGRIYYRSIEYGRCGQAVSEPGERTRTSTLWFGPVDSLCDGAITVPGAGGCRNGG